VAMVVMVEGPSRIRGSAQRGPRYGGSGLTQRAARRVVGSTRGA
jgi:hypothetical protein